MVQDAASTVELDALLKPALEAAPMAVLLFQTSDPHHIIWRNHAHAVMSESVGQDVNGKGLFEAFPPSEVAGGAEAMQGIKDAVRNMVETRKPVEIGPYRYDLIGADGRYAEHHWQIRMSPVFEDGEIVAIMQLGQDVTQSTLATRLSESLTRTAESTASVSYFNFDPATDLFIRGLAVDEMFGFAPGEIGQFAKPFFDRVHPDDLQGVYDEVERVFAAPRGEIAAFDYRVPQPDGTERFIRIRAEVAVDPADRKEKLVGSFIDLTDVEQDRKRLKHEVTMREALVREANHRIKNSLAIALSILRMERRAIDSAGAAGAARQADALAALEARLNAIASAHGHMALQADQIDVSLHSFLRDLVHQSRGQAAVAETDFSFKVTGNDLQLDSEKAISLGLILNEVFTNALKYGLHSDGTAQIEVTVDTTDDQARITVSNKIAPKNSIGEIASTKLGGRLIEQMAGAFPMVVDSGANGDVHVTELRWTPQRTE